MILLFLLLLTLLVTPSLSQDCDQGACYYFVTCYDVSKMKGNAIEPRIRGTTNGERALDRKSKCASFGFISVLSIVPVTASVWNFTFDTHLPKAGFTLGRLSSDLYIFFGTSDKVEARVYQTKKEITHTKSSSAAILGQTTYSFQLDAQTFNLTKPLKSTPGEPIKFTANMKDEPSVNEDGFWKALREKLVCDPSELLDACQDRSDCVTAAITGRAVECPAGTELLIAQWIPVVYVRCESGKWHYKRGIDNQTSPAAKEETIFCRKVAPPVTEALSTTTAEPVTELPETTSAAPTTHQSHRPEPVDPVRQEAAETSTISAPAADTKEKEKSKASWMENKWVWLGIGGAALVVAVLITVILCVVCSKSKKNADKKEKTGKSINNKKKKDKRETSVSAAQSTSESKADASQPLIVASAASSSVPPSSGEIGTTTVKGSEVTVTQQTEAGLDRLKTQVF